MDQITPPLVVILGQTASGKSSLAMEIAKKFDAEIICADSRTVYRRMDIGTAKPSKQDQELVRHHLLDIVEPDQPFNVSDFKRLAIEAIEDIASRSKLALMVGGSGLYIDSVIYDYQFREKKQKVDPSLSIEQLQQAVADQGLELPENRKNRRHLIGVLQSGQNPPNNKRLRDNCLIIGLDPGKERLLKNIKQRVEASLEAGLIAELKGLVDEFGWEPYALQAPAYLSFRGYLESSMNIAEATQKNVLADKKLAKKQATWFKRNKSIHWLKNPSQYVSSTTELVNNFIRNE